MNKQNFNFNYSVSSNPYDRNKDAANALKWREKEGNIFTLSEDIKYGYAFCNCFHHDGVFFWNVDKTDINIKSANIISIDLDAVKYPYSEFYEIMSTSEIVPTIIYTTANDGVSKHGETYTNRYRVIYIIDGSILNNTLYKTIHQNIKKEIELITEDKNIFNDNTDCSVSHFFAGNTNTNIIENNEIYSLKWLIDRYSINAQNTQVLNNSLTINTQNENISKNGYISKMLDKKINDIKSDTQSHNKEEERNIIQLCDTFSEIENEPFIKDYYQMNIKELINKYISVYPSFESTQLHFNEIDPFVYLPSDYTEITRKWGYEEIECNGNIINIMRIHKSKDGERRRKTLFINLLLRKRIYPNITFCHLLFNAVYELFYYIDNVNFKDGYEDKINKNEIAQITVNAFFAHNSIKNREIRKYKINPLYCANHNISKRQCNMSKINKEKNTQKQKALEELRALYDEKMTDEQNLNILNEHLEKSINIRTFKRYKKELRITKNKKRNINDMERNNKNTESANIERTSPQITMMGQSTTKDRTEQQSVNKYPFWLICYNVPKFEKMDKLYYVPTPKNYMPFV